MVRCWLPATKAVVDVPRSNVLRTLTVLSFSSIVTRPDASRRSTAVAPVTGSTLVRENGPAWGVDSGASTAHAGTDAHATPHGSSTLAVNTHSTFFSFMSPTPCPDTPDRDGLATPPV